MSGRRYRHNCSHGVPNPRRPERSACLGELRVAQAAQAALRLIHAYARGRERMRGVANAYMSLLHKRVQRARDARCAERSTNEWHIPWSK
jgi:hypothetical protein